MKDYMPFEDNDLYPHLRIWFSEEPNIETLEEIKFLIDKTLPGVKVSAYEFVFRIPIVTDRKFIYKFYVVPDKTGSPRDVPYICLLAELRDVIISRFQNVTGFGFGPLNPHKLVME